MASCKFGLESIVTKFESPNVKIKDPKKLQVQVTFFNQTLNITASRINVTEFKDGSSIDFDAEPSKLRKKLERCGIPVSISCKDVALGNGTIILPEKVTNQIADDMKELLIQESCKFEKSGEAAGTVELSCRLIIKCVDQPKNENSKELSCNVNKNINAQDIMFLVSQSQSCPNPCDPCADALNPEEGDDYLKLDIYRYESIKPDVPTPSMDVFKHDPVGEFVKSELKKLATECENVVDSVLKSTGLSPRMAPDNTVEKVESPSLAPVLDFPLNDEGQAQIASIRFCPVCLTSMSWLPKFASCPNCSTKPMPVTEKPPEKEQLTVDNILNKYLGKLPAKTDDFCKTPSDSQKSFEEVCHCTCKNNKLCAHCRVRQLCADIFQPEKKDIPKPESTVSEDTQKDFYMDLAKADDSRPFLERVFSELRVMYDNPTFQKPADSKMESKQNSWIHMAIKKDRSSKKENKPVPDTKSKPFKQKQPNKEKERARKGHKQAKKGQKQSGAKRNMISGRHGWDWSSSPEALKFGWRPGAVSKPILKIMKHFLNDPAKAKNVCSEQISEKSKQMELPSLCVCKKNGEIFITLGGGPTIPITYKIIKSDEALILRELKESLKAKGFRKCTCHQPIMLCTCRDVRELRELRNALDEECEALRMESCAEALVLTDTSESELEFDMNVTPLLPQTRLKRQPKTANNSTQTSPSDLKVPAKYPMKQGDYWLAYDCATGDRFENTAFGRPLEEVFEDGVFHCKGGGPHGKSAYPGPRPKSTSIWGDKPGGPMRGRVRPPGERTRPICKIKKEVKNKRVKVKMPKRFTKAAEEAAKRAQEAEEQAAKDKRKGTDMKKYLMNHKARTSIGPDGLTDKQRLRRALFEVPMPPLDTIPRLGKGCFPCDACYCNPCGRQYYDSCVTQQYNPRPYYC